MKNVLIMGLVVLSVMGIVAPSLYACPDSEIHRMVAEWANVNVEKITPDTKLDGLNEMIWSEDAKSLIVRIEQRCDVKIPKSDYELFARVEDIDDYVGDDFEEEKK